MQLQHIEQQISAIKEELTKLGPMRPGTLSRQYSACQKPGYACIDPIKPKKHGPFYQLSYSHQGESTTRFVRPGYVPQISKELAAYKRFKKLTQSWVTRTESLPSTAREGSPRSRKMTENSALSS